MCVTLLTSKHKLMTKRRLETTNQILQAASELFLKQGFRNVSVDLIASHARTTKVTVYQHFKSKEMILLECLSLRITNREAALDAHFGNDPTATPAIMLEFFDWMEISAKKGKFVGCAFTKAVNEMSETLPEVRHIAQRAKQLLRDRLIFLATSNSLRDPASLGDELATLLEGAQALSLIERRSRPFASARASAIKLLAFHGWTPPTGKTSLRAARHP